MSYSVQTTKQLNPHVQEVQEIETQIEKVLFEENELNYLDQVKVQDLKNQIQKIYLKYAPRQVRQKAQSLQQSINILLEEEEFDIQRYSELDYALKKIMKNLQRPALITTLDEARISRFEERIDEIYYKNQPRDEQLHYIETLLAQREQILNLI